MVKLNLAYSEMWSPLSRVFVGRAGHLLESLSEDFEDKFLTTTKAALLQTELKLQQQLIISTE